MTGATAVVWFLGRSSKARSEQSEPVRLVKTEAIQEAQRAVRESADRADEVQRQRGTVTRMVARLVEVREANNFARGIRAAMGGKE